MSSPTPAPAARPLDPPIAPTKPTGIRDVWLPFTIIGFGSFALSAANSGISIAIPRIGEALSTDVTLLAWIPLVQNLAMTGLLLPFGWAGDRFGHRPVYTIGLVIGALGAVLSSLSPGFLALLAARFIMTAGTAMSVAVTPAITVNLVSPERRGSVLGWSVMFTYIGLSGGPILAGFAVGLWDWQGALWMAAPLLLLLAIVTPLLVPDYERTVKPDVAFDFLGAMLLMFGAGGILVVLTRGEFWGWMAPQTIALAIVSGLATLAFVRRELRIEHPLLQLRLFRNTELTSTAAISVLLYVGSWVPPFLMPFYLTQSRGLHTAEAGLIMGAMPVATMIASPFAGMASDKLGTAWLVGLGVAIMSASLVSLGLLGSEDSLIDVAVRLAILGVGFGTAMTPNNSAMMSSVDHTHRGMVGALLGTTRNIGMAVGTAAAATLFGESLVRLTPEIGEAAARLESLKAGYWFVAGLASLGIVVTIYQRFDRDVLRRPSKHSEQ